MSSLHGTDSEEDMDNASHSASFNSEVKQSDFESQFLLYKILIT
jgi:hypothetical protein